MVKTTERYRVSVTIYDLIMKAIPVAIINNRVSIWLDEQNADENNYPYILDVIEPVSEDEINGKRVRPKIDQRPKPKGPKWSKKDLAAAKIGKILRNRPTIQEMEAQIKKEDEKRNAELQIKLKSPEFIAQQPGFKVPVIKVPQEGTSKNKRGKDDHASPKNIIPKDINKTDKSKSVKKQKIVVGSDIKNVHFNTIDRTDLYKKLIIAYNNNVDNLQTMDYVTLKILGDMTYDNLLNERKFNDLNHWINYKGNRESVVSYQKIFDLLLKGTIKFNISKVCEMLGYIGV
jgi:hypothetical protein